MQGLVLKGHMLYHLSCRPKRKTEVMDTLVYQTLAEALGLAGIPVILGSDWSDEPIGTPLSLSVVRYRGDVGDRYRGLHMDRRLSSL